MYIPICVSFHLRINPHQTVRVRPVVHERHVWSVTQSDNYGTSLLPVYKIILHASACVHTTALVQTPLTQEARKQQISLSLWEKITDARAIGKTRTLLLLEPHPLPFPHPKLTPVCPSKPASSLPWADVLWQHAQLLSSCQGWIIALEKTASPFVRQVSILAWCLDMKNMPVMPSRHSGWQEMKETDRKPRPVVGIRVRDLLLSGVYFKEHLDNKTFVVLHP